MNRKAEIISVGDEILGGHTVDTNSNWMSKTLRKCGLFTFRVHTIGDKASEIIQALDRIDPQSDYVFMTGGLGPTKDDLKKKLLRHISGVSSNLMQRYIIH